MSRFSCSAALAIGVVALSSCGALAQAQHTAEATSASPNAIEITLSSYAFTPQVIELKSGGTYRLHFVNSASKSHNFSAPEFFQAVTVAPADKSKVSDGKVELDEGQAVDVTVTANTPGTYAVECTHFLHASFGMKGQAIIR